MRNLFWVLTLIFISCNESPTTPLNKNATSNMVGTWKLISGTLIENGDTLVTEYTTNRSFIKIINDTHFSFLHHDLNNGTDSAAVFSAGGGTYTLADSTYTEHLEYCSARNWEGHEFPFVITIKNDTLIQQGIEKIESAGVNRLNIEKYVRWQQSETRK